MIGIEVGLPPGDRRFHPGVPGHGRAVGFQGRERSASVIRGCRQVAPEGKGAGIVAAVLEDKVVPRDAHRAVPDEKRFDAAGKGGTAIGPVRSIAAPNADGTVVFGGSGKVRPVFQVNFEMLRKAGMCLGSRGGCRSRFRTRAFEFGVVAVGNMVALGIEQEYLAVVGVRSGEQVELFVGDEKGKVAVLRSRIRRGETFAGAYVPIGGVIVAVEVFYPDAFRRFEVGDGFALLSLHVPDGKFEMDTQAGLSILRNVVLQPDPVDGGRSGESGTPQAEDRQENSAKEMLHGSRKIRIGVRGCPGGSGWVGSLPRQDQRYGMLWGKWCFFRWKMAGFSHGAKEGKMPSVF